MSGKEEAFWRLVCAVTEMGYPKSFGVEIANTLRTEKMMLRMTKYLQSAMPSSAEEIADEALAIAEQRDMWVSKKVSEYYSRKYNEILNDGLFGDTDELEYDPETDTWVHSGD